MFVHTTLNGPKLFSQTYKDAERKEKFMMRFFLKEIRNQVLALQFQFDAALETLDAQAREER